MGKKIEMIGRKFGRLLVVSESGKRDKSGALRYICKCECGVKREVSGISLRAGRTVSCGCYNRELICGDKVPGGSRSGLYRIRLAMIRRCTNPSDKAFLNYGGRGITVCDEWLASYHAFYDWATSNGYRKGLWLDRVDNDKGYSPENCRFSTPSEQQNNKRGNRLVVYRKKSYTMSELAKLLNLPRATLERRVELGWDESSLDLPVKTQYSRSYSRVRHDKGRPRTEIVITKAEP